MGPMFQIDLDDFRDDISSFLDDDRVAHTNIFALDFFLIVERRAADRASGKKYRF